LLHIPVGMAFVLLVCCCHWAVGLGFLAGFIVYEISQDKKIKDNAFVDICGSLWGIPLMAIILKLGGLL